KPAQVAKPAPATKPAPKVAKVEKGAEGGGIRRVPMTRIRQRIAQHLVGAQQNAAMLTTFNEVDMSGVMALRAEYKEQFTEIHGVSLGFMSFFSRAVAMALQEFEVINAWIEGEEIVYHDYVNLGIAVGTERGLVVPVLQRVEQMSMAEIESEIKRVARGARDNRLSMDDLTGGTFTITNGGIFGSLLSTPILNAPQSGILGMHAIQQRPVAVDGKVEIRPMMYVALSYDHRLVDGQQSVSFLVRVKQLVEDPVRLLLQV
ncbi:MAG: dihydrolipoyllysine-residue succinyltransferase, partial [Gemmatimonadetes bacterium]|nr:dihydrolipoyllysine-residue succinyltransferase [Gemmatimonadota bacterium]